MANDDTPNPFHQQAVIENLLRDVERTASLLQRLLDRMGDASVDRERLSVHVEILQTSVEKLTRDLSALREVTSDEEGRVSGLEGAFGDLEDQVMDLQDDQDRKSSARETGKWALLATLGGAIAAGLFSLIETLLGKL